MKKKFLALFLAVVMTAGLLSGCGSQESAQKTEETSQSSTDESADESVAENPEEETKEPEEETKEDESVSSYDEILEALSYDVDKMPNGYKSVVYVSGSWHDMGYQYATQASEAVKRKVLNGISAYSYAMDEYLSQVPKYVDHYNQYAPELVEFYEGMAEGIGIDFDMFMLGTISFVEDHSADVEDTARDEEGCSTISAWGNATGDGGLIVGADWDSIGYDCYYTPSIVGYPEDGNAFISECGLEGNIAVNDKGLVCAGSSGQSANPEDNAMGMPVMASTVMLAALCDTADEAAERYLSGWYSIYGENQVYQDVNGGHIVVEATNAHNDTRKPGDFGEVDYQITTNDFMTEEMLSSLLPEGSGYDDCRPRYWSEEKVLLDANGEATIRTIADAISCTNYYVDGQWHEGDWSLETGLNSPENLSPFYQNVMKGIAVPENGTMYLMNGCSNTNVSLLPDASGNFVQVMIDTDPFLSAADARTTSNMLIFSAGAHIDSFEGDSSALTDALNIAKEAQIKGDSYYNMANCVSDANESLEYCSLAASQYLKAQAYAQTALEDDQAVLDY